MVSNTIARSNAVFVLRDWGIARICRLSKLSVKSTSGLLGRRCAVECLARDQEVMEESETYNWEWVYFYRQAYEAEADVTPPPTYDDDDVQAFEQPGREALQTDDDGDDSALES
jgi:hypothetical protein